MNTVYQRTTKGEQEIKKRTYKLDHEHRFVLIMIDGKADVANIISRSSIQWNPKQCLYEMEVQGFIENSNPNARSKSSLSKLKQDLIMTIEKLLPEKNKKIINKIINSKMNNKDLTQAIDSGCFFIKLTVSERLSTQLKQELHQILNSSSEV